MESFKSELRDGMRIDWDVPITMDDGLVLRCDVYRPADDGKYPVIMHYGPYNKWLHLQDGYPAQWKVMTDKHPETVQGTSNKYQNWEAVDPGEVGSGRLRLRARGLARGRPVAGIHGTSIRHARPKISTTASSGRPSSRGAAARSG